VAFFAKLAPCLVAMEACGSAHYWGREIAKLGHSVRLMPPQHLLASELPGDDDLALGIDAVDLEHLLCNIDPDGGNCSHGRPLSGDSSPTITLRHLDAL